eukprot:symbB.v1.2.035677.t1/scaffold4720.1/size35926/1
MAGIYTMIFFGLMIFHWDLHALIHPSGGEIFRNHTHEATAVHMSTAAPSHVTAAVSTSIAMAMREVWDFEWQLAVEWCGLVALCR